MDGQTDRQLVCTAKIKFGSNVRQLDMLTVKQHYSSSSQSAYKAITLDDPCVLRLAISIDIVGLMTDYSFSFVKSPHRACPRFDG